MDGQVHESVYNRTVQIRKPQDNKAMYVCCIIPTYDTYDTGYGHDAIDPYDIDASALHAAEVGDVAEGVWPIRKGLHGKACVALVVKPHLSRANTLS